MRQHLATAARVFFPAYAGAMVWVLAGCGWGVVIGSALEATFGQGADGLLDAAGETSLLAAAGALVGMVGMTLVLAVGHIVTLVPLFYLIGKVGKLIIPSADWQRDPMSRHAALAGLLTSLACALLNGSWAGPIGGAGVVLESVLGRPVPRTILQSCTLLGLLAGGIIGLVAMGREIYRGIPANWREGLRRGMGSGACGRL
jgi:hypothetical protein